MKLFVQAEIVVLGGAFFINGNVNPAGTTSPLAVRKKRSLSIVTHSGKVL